jgi:hypothetical protein
MKDNWCELGTCRAAQLEAERDEVSKMNMQLEKSSIDRLVRAEAAEAERDELARQLEQARKALAVISATVAGLEKQPAPVIKRSIKEIQGWTRAALS